MNKWKHGIDFNTAIRVFDEEDRLEIFDVEHSGDEDRYNTIERSLIHMTYSFEEIMEYHQDNRDIYEEIKHNLSAIVPFVGAGLSCFAYGTWPDLLDSLTKKISDKRNRIDIYSKIRLEKFDEAAQQLEDIRGHVNLSRDIVNYFSLERFNRNYDKLPMEPVQILPHLFSGLILTTNYDEILEAVYQEIGHQMQVIHPGHSELLSQVLRNPIGCYLYKFHGTVTGSYIEYNNIVFTKEQYDQHYQESSALCGDLKKCLKAKILLFLGCSLKQDRVMKLLMNTVEEGEFYYTIIPSKKGERDDKARELGERHIRAILYEDGHHEAVRVVLEQLIKETKPDVYKNLRYHVGQQCPSTVSECLAYNAETISFTGRTEELKQLKAFLDDNQTFRWWAITGPEGSGRSRLAYEFQKRLPESWDIYYLSLNDYNNLPALSRRFSRRTFVIADYIEEHAREVGAWMEQLLLEPCKYPIRILLIGRFYGSVAENPGWNRSLEDIKISIHDGAESVHDLIFPMSSANLSSEEPGTFSSVLARGNIWEKQIYGDIHNKKLVRSACFKEDYLDLKPLSDKELLKIMGDCSYALQKNNKGGIKVPDEKIKKKLLQKLKSIDPDLQRPLYAVFIASVYMDGSKPERWNRNYLLDYMVECEHDRLDFVIRNVTGVKISDRKLFAACQYMQCVSTVLNGIPVEEFRKICPDIWNIIQSKAEYFESPVDLLCQLGLVDKDVITPIRPYLIGEHFLFEWMQRRRETLQSFLNAIWKFPHPTVVFLNRLLIDYSSFMNESAEKWDILLLAEVPASAESAVIYAMLLINVENYCDIQSKCKEIILQLKKLTECYPDEFKITYAAAATMMDTIIKLDKYDAQETAKQLVHLVNTHENMPELEIILAIGLANLCPKLDAAEAGMVADYLKEMVDSHPDFSELAEFYANSLVTLGQKLTGAESLDNFKRLKSLADKYCCSQKIAIMLSKCAYNLTVGQKRQDMQEAVGYLEKINASFPDITEIAVLYAEGLFNLSREYNGEEVLDVIMRLKKLVNSYPSVSEVAKELAKALVNYSVKQDTKERWDTVEYLKKLVFAFPHADDIVVAYSNGLVNICNSQNIPEAVKAVRMLETLAGNYSEMDEVIISLANGLFNLCIHQELPKLQKSLLQLEKLSLSHPELTKILVVYMKALHVAAYRQFKEDTRMFIACDKKLSAIAEAHTDNRDIVIAYANYLVTLCSLVHDKRKAEIIVDKLKAYVVLYPKSAEIESAYVKGLIHLAAKSSAEETVLQLRQVMEDYPYISDVVTPYAISLYNLCLGQSAADAEKTVEELQNLVNMHPVNVDVITHCAFGLMALSEKQNKKDALQNLDKLKSIAARYAPTPESQRYFGDLIRQLEEIIAKRSEL